MTAKHGTPVWSDERILEALDLRWEGLSASEIARRLGGVTRNAVLGKFYCIDHDSARVPDLCVKPENRDGGMGRGWWRRGGVA